MAKEVVLASGREIDVWIGGTYEIYVTMKEKIQDANQYMIPTICTRMSSGTGPGILMNYTCTVVYEYLGQEYTEAVSGRNFVRSGSLDISNLTVNDTNRSHSFQVIVKSVEFSMSGGLYKDSFSWSGSADVDATPTQTLNLKYNVDPPGASSKSIETVTVIPTHQVSVRGEYLYAGYHCKDFGGYEEGTLIYINRNTTLTAETYVGITYYVNIVNRWGQPTSGDTPKDEYVPRAITATYGTPFILPDASEAKITLYNGKILKGYSLTDGGQYFDGFVGSPMCNLTQTEFDSVDIYTIVSDEYHTVETDIGYQSDIGYTFTDTMSVEDGASVGIYLTPLRNNCFLFSGWKSYNNPSLLIQKGDTYNLGLKALCRIGSENSVMNYGWRTPTYYSTADSDWVYLAGLVTYQHTTQQSLSDGTTKTIVGRYTAPVVIRSSQSQERQWWDNLYVNWGEAGQKQVAVDDIENYYEYHWDEDTQTGGYVDSALSKLTPESEFLEDESGGGMLNLSKLTGTVFDANSITFLSDIRNAVFDAYFLDGIMVDSSHSIPVYHDTTITATWDISDSNKLYFKMYSDWKRCVPFQKINSVWRQQFPMLKRQGVYDSPDYEFVCKMSLAGMGISDFYHLISMKDPYFQRYGVQTQSVEVTGCKVDGVEVGADYRVHKDSILAFDYQELQISTERSGSNCNVLYNGQASNMSIDTSTLFDCTNDPQFTDDYNGLVVIEILSQGRTLACAQFNHETCINREQISIQSLSNLSMDSSSTPFSAFDSVTYYDNPHMLDAKVLYQRSSGERICLVNFVYNMEDILHATEITIHILSLRTIQNMPSSVLVSVQGAPAEEYPVVPVSPGGSSAPIVAEIVVPISHDILSNTQFRNSSDFLTTNDYSILLAWTG